MRAWNARATRMTPDQVADAHRLAREWDAAHPRGPGDPLAGLVYALELAR